MIEVFAHRGAHAKQRENTLDAFLEARALNLDGVELDVRRTLDGRLVVHHDPFAEGRDIAQSAARDLPDYVPTLDEALEVLRGIKVNVEIKNSKDPGEGVYDDTGTFVRQVIDELHDADFVDSVIVSCFDLTTCAQARAYDVDLRVAWLLWLVELDSAMTQAHVLGLNAVNPHFKIVSAASQQRARELGLEVNVWTVNEEADLRAMAALEVDSVITDRPAFAMELFASIGS